MGHLFQSINELRKKYPWPEDRPIGITPRRDMGWFCGQNIACLKRAIIETKAKVVLELGAFVGLSTRFIRKAFNTS